MPFFNYTIYSIKKFDRMSRISCFYFCFSHVQIFCNVPCIIFAIWVASINKRQSQWKIKHFYLLYLQPLPTVAFKITYNKLINKKEESQGNNKTSKQLILKGKNLNCESHFQWSIKLMHILTVLTQILKLTPNINC